MQQTFRQLLNIFNKYLIDIVQKFNKSKLSHRIKFIDSIFNRKIIITKAHREYIFPNNFKQLTMESIEKSPEILAWLSQFSPENQIVAKSLLLHLKFVTRDYYSNWLIKSIESLPLDNVYAIYAVRKLSECQVCLWDCQGNVVIRPGTALGSEDFVYQLISHIVRSDAKKFIDHASLTDLKSKKIHNIVLIDDSIGSGDRISNFINSMMTNKSFKSWWSYGFINFHIFAIARTIESEKAIVQKIPGSDHGKRKYPVSSKIHFQSENIYSKNWLSRRWGNQYQTILDLCDLTKAINKKWRRGYDNVMSNIIFYHSVPNNIPGVLFFSGRRWKPLFQGRVVPTWLTSLLEEASLISNVDYSKSIAYYNNNLSQNILYLLFLIKSGIRNKSSIALRMDCDIRFIKSRLLEMEKVGLITDKLRLTKAGKQILINQYGKNGYMRIKFNNVNRDLYIPKTWRADQTTIQPAAQGEVTLCGQSYPAKDYSSAGGEAGQVSLERSDERSALPTLDIRSQAPSKPRKGPDIHGPLDSKDK